MGKKSNGRRRRNAKYDIKPSIYTCIMYICIYICQPRISIEQSGKKKPLNRDSSNE